MLVLCGGRCVRLIVRNSVLCRGKCYRSCILYTRSAGLVWYIICVCCMMYSGVDVLVCSCGHVIADGI